MARKGKLTNKQRISAVEDYMKGDGSYGSINAVTARTIPRLTNPRFA